ncbi:ECF transporter S component [Thermoanaerobacterium sp. DL9XJH110]|uniref:ECF transporter S component n=1 Tax=Thermoanaerobacterium sp. DL9XJH110 TaxID=3386643 RepID=UPI003BB4BAAD
MQKTKNLVLTGMFIALSAAGAAIKLPSPTGTVAFDSAPGFLAALFLGPGYGAVTAALGHLFTGFLAGFPLTLPLHLIIALEMAVFAWVYGRLKRFSLPLAVVAATLLNGIVAPASFIPLPQFGFGFFAAMVIPLLSASFANVALAALVYRAVAAVFKPDEASLSNR